MNCKTILSGARDVQGAASALSGEQPSFGTGGPLRSGKSKSSSGTEAASSAWAAVLLGGFHRRSVRCRVPLPGKSRLGRPLQSGGRASRPPVCTRRGIGRRERVARAMHGRLPIGMGSITRGRARGPPALLALTMIPGACEPSIERDREVMSFGDHSGKSAGDYGNELGGAITRRRAVQLGATAVAVLGVGRLARGPRPDPGRPTPDAIAHSTRAGGSRSEIRPEPSRRASMTAAGGCWISRTTGVSRTSLSTRSPR